METQTAAPTWDLETGEVFPEAGDADTQLANVPHVTRGPIAAPIDDGSGSMINMIVRAAQDMQRDPKTLIERAKQIGGLLGKKGFYRFPAGGKTIEGESVHLAQALAQEWGGIVYQTRIMNAEPLAGGGQRVHLRASVADLRALVCAEGDQVINTAPPPGKFAKDHDQRERWNGMQVQNASSKVVRNAILDVLPKWYTQPAFEAAKDAADAQALGKNADGTPRTLPQARLVALDSLTPKGCSKEELEKYLGQPYDMWATPQLGQLRELFADLRSGKVSIESWRQTLAEADEQESKSAPRRNTLGVPSNGGEAEATGKKGK